MDFSGCPIDPPGGGGWTLDLSESPTDPLGGGRLDLGLLKRANPSTRMSDPSTRMSEAVSAEPLQHKESKKTPFGNNTEARET